MIILYEHGNKLFLYTNSKTTSIKTLLPLEADMFNERRGIQKIEMKMNIYTRIIIQEQNMPLRYPETILRL